MKKHSQNCADGTCPVGIEELRKIGLTPKEKRAIFHSIMDFKKDELKISEESCGAGTPESLSV
jgi:hypothetical protein